MRELIYLSQGKLRQFQTERRAGLWQRIRQVGVKAPLGIGLDVTLSDATTESHPSLAKVLKHIDRSDRPARWFEEEGLQVGEWVKFKARLNYVIYSELVTLGGQPAPASPPPPPLFFWQPRPNPEAPDNVMLLLHGSPENLVGINPTDVPSTVAIIQRVGSVLAEVSKYLFALRVAEPHDLPSDMDDFQVQIYELCVRLYSKLPPETASWMAGYAKVTALIQLPSFKNRRALDLSNRLVLATPLYVEQVPTNPFVSKGKQKKQKKSDR